jgi:hypothetical protein
MESQKSETTKHILIGILAFVSGVLLSYIIFTIFAPTPKPVASSSNNQNIQSVPVPDVSIVQSPTNPDENTFSSTSLKLSFNFSKYVYSFDENGPGLNRSLPVNPPYVVGTTIYFGPLRAVLPTIGAVDFGPHLTVYQKQPTQSLEAAIQSQFLQGIPSSKCLTVRAQSDSDSTLYTTTSTISYVRLQAAVPNGCPSQFDFSNSTATFFSFANQPNTFFYVVGSADGTMPLTTSTGDLFWTTMKFSN